MFFDRDERIARWKEKYYSSLETLGQKEQQWEEIERALYQDMARLALVPYGNNRKLDGHLDALRKALRRQQSHSLLSPLIEAAHKAVEHPDATAAPSATGRQKPPALHQDAAQPLIQLLDALILPEQYLPEIIKWKECLDGAEAGQWLDEAIPAITKLVIKMRLHFQHERQEVELFLRVIDGRLEDIDEFLALSDESRDDSLDARTRLQESVRSTVGNMGEDARDATELGELRLALQQRVGVLQGHLEKFITEEHKQQERLEAGQEKLKTRLDELEREGYGLRETLRTQHREALLDSLTHVYNRAAYDERIMQEYARWQRYGQPLSLVFWDIDNFKQVNDRFGHAAGDKVLTTFANKLQNTCRKTDFVARYGGEEFIILMPATSQEEALQVAEKLRTQVENIRFTFQGKPLQITASCGLTEFHQGDTPESALERSDKALYQAKDGGRNQCRTA